MSIYAYVGMPGSGKSYDVVANQIMPALKQGRRVVTNIPLHLDVVRQVVPDAQVDELPLERIESQPELIDDYAKPGVVLVIDECWRLWPSGLKAHQVPEVYKTLLAEHRHRVDEAGNAMLIVLVTQDLAQLSAFARQLVEQTFYHSKLTHLGSAGSYRIDVYRGPQTGANPPRSERLREILGRYDKSIFKLYKSHTMSESGQAGANEKTMDGRGVIWRKPGVWFAALGCVAALVWGVPTAIGALKDPTGRGAPAASGATGGSPAPAGVAAARQPVAASPSSVWRITGEIRGFPGGDLVTLENGSEWIQLPVDAYCDRDLTGYLVCTWQGMEISNQVRRYRAAGVERAEARPSPILAGS